VRATGAWLGRAQGDGRAGAARPRARGRRAGAAAAGGRGSGVSGVGVRHGRVSAARAGAGVTARCGKRAGGALEQEQAQARARAIAARPRELAAVCRSWRSCMSSHAGARRLDSAEGPAARQGRGERVSSSRKRRSSCATCRTTACRAAAVGGFTREQQVRA
jgi:hypothetical protein